MLNKIDARGLSCPQPVLLTKKALQSKPEEVVIVVDNETAKGNILRFLNKSGYNVELEGSGENIELKATKKLISMKRSLDQN